MIILNNKPIKITEFPNGETHIDSKDLAECMNGRYSNSHVIKFKYENDSDLIKLMFIKKHLDSTNEETMLIIYYMPYSRMDRTEGKKVFTLKYVADFINSLNFKGVLVYQPHSDVTPALLNRCSTVDMSEKLLNKILDKVEFDKDRDYIYYPDASAEKHFGKSNNYNGLVGLKQRDFVTGNIIKLDVVGEIPKEKGFKVIMIDDLCSRGGTFILGAKKLKELGAGEIYLVVTHCEESILSGDVFNSGLINKVFTTNSIISDTSNSEKLEILNLFTENH